MSVAVAEFVRAWSLPLKREYYQEVCRTVANIVYYSMEVKSSIYLILKMNQLSFSLTTLKKHSNRMLDSLQKSASPPLEHVDVIHRVKHPKWLMGQHLLPIEMFSYKKNNLTYVKYNLTKTKLHKKNFWINILLELFCSSIGYKFITISEQKMIWIATFCVCDID